MAREELQNDKRDIKSFLFSLSASSLIRAILALFTIATVIFALQVKFSTDRHLVRIINASSNSIRLLSELDALGYDSFFRDLQSRLVEKYSLNDISIVPRESDGLCYGLQKNLVCWSLGGVTAYVRGQFLGKDCVFALSSPIRLMDRDLAASLLVLVFAVVISYLTILWSIYEKGVRHIVDPIRMLHGNIGSLTVSSGDFELAEFRDLASAIIEYKKSTHLKMKMKFTQDFTHEMKSPLNLIVNQLIRIRHLNDDVRRIAVIDETIERAERAISEVSAILKRFREEDEYEINFSRVDLNEVLPKELRLSTPISIIGDSFLLQCLFSNLYMNSLEGSGSRSGIWFDCRVEEGGAIRIVMGNVGAANVIDCEWIFQRGTTTKRGGTGLGLDFCRRIVELHGGRIWAEKLDDDKIEVSLRLPRVLADTPVSVSAP